MGTHGDQNKLEVWAELAVGEVWIWRQGTIDVHVLEAGVYRRTPGSSLLPNLDIAHLLRFVSEDNQTEAIRRYVAEIRGM